MDDHQHWGKCKVGVVVFHQKTLYLWLVIQLPTFFVIYKLCGFHSSKGVFDKTIYSMGQIGRQNPILTLC
jgi:hypothetical protein